MQIKEKKSKLVYLIIARVKDSDSNPWVEFETDDHEVAKNKITNLIAANTSRVYKIETRTITGEELEQFSKSKKMDKMIEDAIVSGKIPL